jgi:superfamily I DNA/RNA helicase
MTWNDGLVGKALNIAGDPAKSLRVMAGPGTGKTFAIKRRVIRLLEEGTDPDKIFGVTFTRVAAASLVAELRAVGVEGCEKIEAGTLHSFCFRLLQRDEVLDFLGRIPRPLVTYSDKAVLQYEAAPLLADISLDGGRKGTKRIQAFEAAWARLQSDEPGWPSAEDKEFHEALIAWLSFHEAMLIGEVVPEALKYLRSNPTAPILDAFEHVVVDEYQDLNRADQAVIDLLSKNNIVIVGDENQSIYRFRYAHPQGILEYGSTHAGTVDQDLDECRRCPRRVVEMANNLILHNHPGVTTPKLRPRAANGEGNVQIVQWRTMEEEAAGIAAYVNYLTKNGFGPEEILILTPRRRIAYLLREALLKLAVPLHSFYQEEALDNPEAQKSCTLLTLLANPEDRVALRFWLGQGSSSWLKGQYAKLRNYCEQSGHSPRSALDAVTAGQIQIAGIGILQQKYLELLGALQALNGKVGKELVDAIAPEDSPALQLFRSALAWVAEEDEEADASEFVGRVRTAVTQPESPEDAKCVRIMSLQKSKGLTSRAVIVGGCIEGYVPTLPTDEPPQELAEILREQRRLFYVAMTRPTDTLVLSSFASMPRGMVHQTQARARQGYGIDVTQASRFIAELGPHAPPSQVGTTWLKTLGAI